MNLPQPQIILLILARRHPRMIAEMYPRYAPLDIANNETRPHIKALVLAGYLERSSTLMGAPFFQLTEAGVQAQAEVDPLIEWDDNESDLRRLRFRTTTP